MAIGDERHAVHIEEETDSTAHRRGYLINLVNITVIAKAKERIDEEPDIARRIQADSLPVVFPPFPEKT